MLVTSRYNKMKIVQEEKLEGKKEQEDDNDIN